MGTMIELTTSDGHKLGAYVAEPSGMPRAGVLVIQEIFGVNAHIRAVAASYAEVGYVALAPALMDRVERGVELGYDEAGVARGRELVARVGFDNATRDVKAAADALRAEGLAVAAVGFCWGGTVALLSNTRLKLPAVSYYGGRSVPFLHERLGAPMLFHFGERDPIITPEHVALTNAAYPHAEHYVYAAGHGFNCDQRQDFDAEAAGLARERTLAFFDRVL